MALARNARGGRVTLQLPQPLPWKAAEKARELYARRADDLRQAQGRLSELRDARPAAAAKDRAALAAALAAGEKDPGTPEADRLEKAIAEAEREVAARELLLDEAEEALFAVVAEHRVEWARQLEEQMDAERARYAEAVDALVAARNRIDESASLKVWVLAFTPADPYYRPQRLRFDGQLVGPNGDPYYFEQIVDALRGDADPRPVKRVA